MNRYFISDGTTDFDVYVAIDADMDGAFEAIDAATGERFRINGWMATDIDLIEEA